MSGLESFREAEHSPKNPLVITAVVIAGIGSVALYPLPSWLFVRCLLVGVLAGALCMPRVTALSWIGTAVLFIGWMWISDMAVERIGASAPAEWHARWRLQTILVLFGAMAMAVYARDFFAWLRRLQSRRSTPS